MTITIEIPEQVMLLSHVCQTTPEAILTSYMADLCHLQGSGGSDERTMAQSYFLRGAIAGVDQRTVGALLGQFDYISEKWYGLGEPTDASESLEEWKAKSTERFDRQKARFDQVEQEELAKLRKEMGIKPTHKA